MALSTPIILELIGLFGKFMPQRTGNFSAMNPLLLWLFHTSAEAILLWTLKRKDSTFNILGHQTSSLISRHKAINIRTTYTNLILALMQDFFCIVNLRSINKLHKHATIGAHSERAQVGTDQRQNFQQASIAAKFQNRTLICHQQDNIRCC